MAHDDTDGRMGKIQTLFSFLFFFFHFEAKLVFSELNSAC